LYNFRIHGQEIGRRRHLRTHLLREFQLWRRKKVLYTYDFLDLREWEMRVLDIEPGSAEAWQTRAVAAKKFVYGLASVNSVGFPPSSERGVLSL
jgi:hypothetical protein